MLLTPRALNRATLARQLLLERAALDPVAAVAHLGGLQAQEPKPPFVALWSRLRHLDEDALRAAIHDRTLVRATYWRGTLHLVTAEDFLRFCGDGSAWTDAVVRMYGDRAAGMDVEAVLAAAREYFAEGPTTFTAMRPRLVARFPGVEPGALALAARYGVPTVLVPTDARWGYPARGAFTPVEDWLGRSAEPGSDPAGLVLRYLAAYGPATPQDAQVWSGRTALKPVFEELRPRLRTFTDERGRELFDLEDAPRPGEDADAPVRYLSEFDNLVLGHDDRSRMVDDDHRPRLITKNGRIPGTFLWDGRVAGTWRATADKRRATLTLQPFVPLPRAAAAPLEAEGDALLAWLEPAATAREVVLLPSDT